MTVTHFFFGPTPQARYVTEPSVEVAHHSIGANVVAGFTVGRYSTDREGRPLRTPDGELLLVVTLTGSSHTFGAFAFVGEGGR
ncbi:MULTISPECIES: hypothetical protein [unclassified Streptomyces]|uniref:hypothetical protein n=1 Tax=unclassified Streptomyces TaxID=2593676 RepID=UPI0035D93816